MLWCKNYWNALGVCPAQKLIPATATEPKTANMQATRLCVTLEQIHRQSTINGLFWEPTNTEFLIADLEHRIYHLRPTPKPVVLYQHQPKTLAKDLPAPASVEEEPAVEYLLDEPEYRSDSEGEYDYPDWED